MVQQQIRCELERHIPTLPVLAARILALCQEDEYSTEDLVRLLRTDPAIASRVMRLANSAYYGCWRKISSLQEAVVLLGRVTVEALALGTSVFRTWRRRRVPAEAEELWVHAYLCAVGCEYLGERLPRDRWRSPNETLFVTGLLHDLGKLLFMAHEPDAYLADIAESSSREDLLRRERDRFGRDHAEWGGEAMERWDLPPAIAAVARFHHRDSLREELRPDWEIVRAVDDLLAAEPSEESTLPPALLADLEALLASSSEKARAVYRAIL